jgi:hypothetical protein
MKNICFVSNYKKTFFFEEIAKNLKKEGVNIYWIVLNTMLYDFLLEQGYDKAHLLLINKSCKDLSNPPVGEYKLNELVCSDRALKYYSWSYSYLTNIQKPLLDFIKNNGINYIFGETTYAHEILVTRIIKDTSHNLNCVYLNPMNVRIPTGRFTFLADEFQSVIYDKINSPIEGPLPELSAERPLESIKVEKLVNKSLKTTGKIKRIGRFFSLVNLEKDDPSISPTDFFARLKKGIAEELNRITYFFVKTENASVTEGKNFVIYTLHKQPEASIDVVGRYYDDQYTNIFNIWRFIPADWFIVVKEHNNAIGDRGYFFFKKIKKLRNLILVNENENSHELIKKSRAVFSVSGSIAYEAALFGKPAFLMSSIFFYIHPKCLKIDLDDLRNNGSIYDLLKKAEDKKELFNFKEYIYNKSFPGLISDPLTNPDCMSPTNIELVSIAFLGIINTIN